MNRKTRKADYYDTGPLRAYLQFVLVSKPRAASFCLETSGRREDKLLHIKQLQSSCRNWKLQNKSNISHLLRGEVPTTSHEAASFGNDGFFFFLIRGNCQSASLLHWDHRTCTSIEIILIVYWLCWLQWAVQISRKSSAAPWWLILPPVQLVKLNHSADRGVHRPRLYFTCMRLLFVLFVPVIHRCFSKNIVCVCVFSF